MGRRAAINRHVYEEEDEEDDERVFLTPEAPRIQSYEEEMAFLAKTEQKSTARRKINREMRQNDKYTTKEEQWDDEDEREVQKENEIKSLELVENVALPSVVAEEPCSEPIVKPARPPRLDYHIENIERIEEPMSIAKEIEDKRDESLQQSAILIEDRRGNEEQVDQSIVRVDADSSFVHVDVDRIPTPQHVETIAQAIFDIKPSFEEEEKKNVSEEDNKMTLVHKPVEVQDKAPLNNITPSPPLELITSKPVAISPRRKIVAKKHNSHPLSSSISESTVTKSGALEDTRKCDNFWENELSNNSAMVTTKIPEEPPRMAQENYFFLMDDVEHYDIEIERVTRELEELNLRQQTKKSSHHQTEEVDTYTTLHQKLIAENGRSLIDQDKAPSNPRKRRYNEHNHAKVEFFEEEEIAIDKREAPRKSPRKLDPIGKKSEPSYAKATQSRVSFVNASSEPSHVLRAPEKPSKIPSPARRMPKAHRVTTIESPKKSSDASKSSPAEKPTTLPPLVSPPITNPLGVPAHILEEGGVYPWSKLMQQVIVPHGTDSPVVYVPIFNPAYIAEVKKHVVEPPSPVKQTTAKRKKEPPSLKSKVK